MLCPKLLMEFLFSLRHNLRFRLFYFTSSWGLTSFIGSAPGSSLSACWNEKCLCDSSPILQTWKLFRTLHTWKCTCREPWWHPTLSVLNRFPASCSRWHDLHENFLRAQQVFRSVENWRCRNRTGMRHRKGDCDAWKVDLHQRNRFRIFDTGRWLQTWWEFRRVTSSGEAGKPWKIKCQLWNFQSNVKMFQRHLKKFADF